MSHQFALYGYCLCGAWAHKGPTTYCSHTVHDKLLCPVCCIAQHLAEATCGHVSSPRTSTVITNFPGSDSLGVTLVCTVLLLFLCRPWTHDEPRVYCCKLLQTVHGMLLCTVCCLV